MKTEPIKTAESALNTVPDDPAAATGAHALPAIEAGQRALLQGNDLPRRWAHSAKFVILETGFGCGHNFLAVWDAWRSDPARCERLHFVAIEPHPSTPAALLEAQAGSPRPDLVAALVRAWPALTPNVHVLDFEQGRVQLTLALGEAAAQLPKLRLAADAIHIEGAVCDLPLLKAVGRHAAPGATVSSCNVDPAILAGLRTAGFDVQQMPASGYRGAITAGRFAPRTTVRRPPSTTVRTGSAVVVGAGLAGAAMAQALARQGLSVTVFERESGPARAASGNPAGIFHGTVNADDGTYARLFRAAALAAAVEYRRAIGSGHVSGQVGGLLRLAAATQSRDDLGAMLRRLKLPAEYVQALDAAAASDLAGVPLRHACWHYPAGGWVAPSQWVRHALQSPGVAWRGGVDIRNITREGSGWRLHGPAGELVARCELLVLANAADAQRLVAPLGFAAWPLHQTRGQVTHWPSESTAALRLPVAGEGYVVPLPGGLLCGATRQIGDAGSETRHEDHLINLARLQSLVGLRAPADPSCWQGCVGWRLHSADRLPIAGAMPAANPAAGQKVNQVRLWPRESGLFVLTALGARGLTLAPLLAHLVAAQATGTPWPLEQDLADAVDPARWLVRAARQAG